MIINSQDENSGNIIELIEFNLLLAKIEKK